jgi:hypothetical protein
MLACTTIRCRDQPAGQSDVEVQPAGQSDVEVQPALTQLHDLPPRLPPQAVYAVARDVDVSQTWTHLHVAAKGVQRTLAQAVSRKDQRLHPAVDCKVEQLVELAVRKIRSHKLDYFQPAPVEPLQQ